MPRLRQKTYRLPRTWIGAKHGWVSVLGLVGCVAPHSATRGIQDIPAMVAAVSAQVPAGTPVADARRFMEREGFRCSEQVDAKFLDRSGLDYLSCNRSEGNIVQRVWMIALVHREGRVVEILANTGLTGP